MLHRGRRLRPDLAEVNILRAFRDRVLLRTIVGRVLVETYYTLSPPIAEALVRCPPAAAVVRALLRPAAQLISRFLLGPTWRRIDR